MKVSELTGAQLDYWVAKVEGIADVFLAPTLADDGETEIENALCVAPHAPGTGNGLRQLHYSTEWQEGGPIIERERIDLFFEFDKKMPQLWHAMKHGTPRIAMPTGSGETALIAAMRCLVTSKFGDEVTE